MVVTNNHHGQQGGGHLPPTDFTVLSYNILAKSLGTNTIPWVMKVSDSMEQRVLQAVNTYSSDSNSSPRYRSFSDWVDDVLKPEYMTHFHKNLDSGNYTAMRKLWGCSHPLEHPDDLPETLQKKRQSSSSSSSLSSGGITWVGSDTVLYSAATTTITPTFAKSNQRPVYAKTLRGLLLSLSSSSSSSNNDDQNVFRDLWDEIVSKEETVYDWKVRGPRIFQTICQSKPDLVCLQEYDCHDAKANYFKTQPQQEQEQPQPLETSFAEAMSSIGYSCVFMKDPLTNRTPPSGLGIFWLNDTFETVGDSSSSTTTTTTLSLDCESTALEGALSNHDLKEHWHPVVRKRKNSSSSSSEEQQQQQQQPSSTLMKAADRRHVGICRLKHKATQKKVSLSTMHLMTSSRDNAKSNVYPGEVRAGELEMVHRLVREKVPENDALICVGDFNCNAKDAKRIFSGHITASAGGNGELIFDTGFDPSSETFVWGSHTLRDAFAGIHQWGDKVGIDQYCSSRNANRIEWIDYALYDQDRLLLLSSAEAGDDDKYRTPSESIPNETHPSDHLPLLAKFAFV